MKDRCLSCGERPPERDKAICSECAAASTADQFVPTSEDCGRAHPWPACRCAACALALERVLSESVATHAELAAGGRSLLEAKGPRRWRLGPQVDGSRTVTIVISVLEREKLETAAAASGMKLGAWMKRSSHRQALLELQGEAALVKRMDDLTRAVGELVKQVAELRGRSRGGRSPRRR